MIVTVTQNPALDAFLWLDELHCGHINRVLEISYEPGGKGVNVGCALRSMGHEVLTTGFVGGNTGRRLEERVREYGLSTNFVYVDGETRTNHIVIDERYGGQTMVIESGPTVSRSDLDRLLDQLSRMLTDCRFLVVAGSLPPGMLPSSCLEILRLAHDRGARTALYLHDDDLDVAIDGEPYLVRVDIRDQDTFMGFETDSLDERKRLAAMLLERTSVVIVGSTFDVLVAGREESFRVTSQERSVSGGTVRTDDVFLAGVLHALDRDLDLEMAARTGMACTLAALLHTEDRVLSESRIQDCMDEVEVERLGHV